MSPVVVSVKPTNDKRLSDKLERAARRLRDRVDKLSFSSPVTHVYNPLRYAWKPHVAFLRRAQPTTRVVFMGMNPGPWGMAQTGVPFGEIDSVRDYLGIKAPVGAPESPHPKRPIEGFDCERSEVSGRRLWGLVRERFPDASDFFHDHFVVNFCPLVFMEDTGKNRTPNKLPVHERDPLHQLCNDHLKSVVQTLAPEYLVAVGTYAESCLKHLLDGMSFATDDRSSRRSRSKPAAKSNDLCSFKQPTIVRILHPSPASPAANRGWSGTVLNQLIQSGVWKP